MQSLFRESSLIYIYIITRLLARAYHFNLFWIFIPILSFLIWCKYENILHLSFHCVGLLVIHFKIIFFVKAFSNIPFFFSCKIVYLLGRHPYFHLLRLLKFSWPYNWFQLHDLYFKYRFINVYLLLSTLLHKTGWQLLLGAI